MKPNDDDNGAAEYAEELLSAFQKLKGAKGMSYEFVICEANPLGVMLAKKITAQHRATLSDITGSKRFLPLGNCTFQEGKFLFSMEKPVSGLARRLQAAIKDYTGRKLAIAAGAESADEDDEAGQQTNGHAAGAVSSPTPGKPELATAADLWRNTRNTLSKNLEAYKKAVLSAAAGEPPELMKQITHNLRKLDGILHKLGSQLADSLAKAHQSKDDAERQAELKNSKRVLVDYMSYVKAEPLIGHIDANPFGVQTGLKRGLVESFTQIARAIG